LIKIKATDATYHILWFLIVALFLGEPLRVFEEEITDKDWLVREANEIEGEVKQTVRQGGR
jgi:hypothetical protein